MSESTLTENPLHTTGAATPAANKTAAIPHVAPSPHVSNTDLTTRGMMFDVVLALVPALIMSVWLFQWYALAVIGLSVLSCLGTEALCQRLRGKSISSLNDGSAAVTGLILGLSLPWSAPFYIPLIAGFMAIGLGKAVFGGLGMNLFNPAMVGRAFVMLSFARELGAEAYVRAETSLRFVTEATPLTAAKQAGEALTGLDTLWPLFLGTTNGSLGETSSLALLLGGLYLCIRRSAAWEIPASVLGATLVFGYLAQFAGLSNISGLHQLFAGSAVFTAFFIATDPCSSPLTFRGKVIFGCGVGFFIILLRTFSGYPAGAMFAILLMNAVVPLINRSTIPAPVGGPWPQRR
jgi:Na+-translocating ferredoxin:NAD+ oxidoreductase subunit D